MSAPAQSRSRPVDPELTERILTIAGEQLLQHGYAGLRVERIASAAGCGKTAIYRRWPTREQLVAAVLLKDAVIGDVPDTGSLERDLVIWLLQATTHQGLLELGAGLQPVWSALTDPEVRRLVDGALLRGRRENGRAIVAHAIERDEIPVRTDADALLDMVGGFAVYRSMVRQESLTEDALVRVAHAVASAPPLLAEKG